jgi:hypothetical protein
VAVRAGAISLVLFLGMEASAWRTLPLDSPEPHRFLIRSDLLGVMAVLLAAVPFGNCRHRPSARWVYSLTVTCQVL